MAAFNNRPTHYAPNYGQNPILNSQSNSHQFPNYINQPFPSMPFNNQSNPLPPPMFLPQMTGPSLPEIYSQHSNMFYPASKLPPTIPFNSNPFQHQSEGFVQTPPVSVQNYDYRNYPVQTNIIRPESMAQPSLISSHHSYIQQQSIHLQRPFLQHPIPPPMPPEYSQPTTVANVDYNHLASTLNQPNVNMTQNALNVQHMPSFEANQINQSSIYNETFSTNSLNRHFSNTDSRNINKSQSFASQSTSKFSDEAIKIPSYQPVKPKKTLPLWLREQLEKYEKEKLKKSLEENKVVETNNEEKNQENEDFVVYSDTEEKEVNHHELSEAEIEELIMKSTRKVLTEILLDVTNSEIRTICIETLTDVSNSLKLCKKPLGKAINGDENHDDGGDDGSIDRTTKLSKTLSDDIDDDEDDDEIKFNTNVNIPGICNYESSSSDEDEQTSKTNRTKANEPKPAQVSTSANSAKKVGDDCGSKDKHSSVSSSRVVDQSSSGSKPVDSRRQSDSSHHHHHHQSQQHSHHRSHHRRDSHYKSRPPTNSQERSRYSSSSSGSGSNHHRARHSSAHRRHRSRSRSPARKSSDARRRK